MKTSKILKKIERQMTKQQMAWSNEARTREQQGANERQIHEAFVASCERRSAINIVRWKREALERKGK